MHELQRLQDARRGKDVPPPEAIDITMTVADGDTYGARSKLGSFRQNDENTPRS